MSSRCGKGRECITEPQGPGREEPGWASVPGLAGAGVSLPRDREGDPKVPPLFGLCFSIPATSEMP